MVEKPDFVLELIDHSYDLVFKSLTRRVKEEDFEELKQNFSVNLCLRLVFRYEFF
jgi:hypothetical protein